MKKLFFAALCLLTLTKSFSQEVDSVQLFYDQIEASLNYQQGKIELANGIGSINVPKGFLYLDGRQSAWVLNEIWGNPLDTTTLGMIVPENAKVTQADSWAFIISYDEMGYVKDDDADDIDYEELMEGMKTDTEASNEARKAEGFEPVTLVGWASEPFYDKENKVLHWAKELKFGEAEENTLNYNVRILGRKGVTVLNAVGNMSQLPEIKNSIAPVMASFQYSEGNRYGDFNPDIDEVAAWTIGGLVAGKVLAKAGIFALLVKNIKLIGLALAGIFTAGWKWFRRKTEPPVVKTFEGDQQQQS
jgi:uncharacterized membrane-anchored protein